MSVSVTRGKQGRVLVTLHRPKALNALTLQMVQDIQSALKSTQRSLVFRGEGRAFCAGGDIKRLSGEGGPQYPLEFFTEEYAMDFEISQRPGCVALMHGLVMGGGVGIAAHCSFRVVTESTLWAMPETAIGLFPDVGASFFLPRVKHAGNAVGKFLGLTGHRCKAQDLIFLGLATHYVSKTNWDTLNHELEHSSESTECILDRFATKDYDTSSCFIAQNLDEIVRIFDAPSLSDVFLRLRGSSSDFCKDTLQVLQTKCSPLSLAVTFRSISLGKYLSRSQVFDMEVKIAVNLVTKFRDFQEGVRSAVYDKSHVPKWTYATVEDVPFEIVDSIVSEAQRSSPDKAML